MPQSESTMKTPPSTTKRFHINTLVNQVLKIFESSRNNQQEDPTPKNCMYLLILIFSLLLLLFFF
jgi:hypothetical protein